MRLMGVSAMFVPALRVTTHVEYVGRPLVFLVIWDVVVVAALQDIQAGLGSATAYSAGTVWFGDWLDPRFSE